MFSHPQTRRVTSILLIALGAVLLFLAPDDAWIGAVLMVLGIGAELVAMAIAHRRRD